MVKNTQLLGPCYLFYREYCQQVHILNELLVSSGNSYWVGLTGLSTTSMNKAFSDIAAAGGTTVRTW